MSIFVVLATSQLAAAINSPINSLLEKKRINPWLFLSLSSASHQVFSFSHMNAPSIL